MRDEGGRKEDKPRGGPVDFRAVWEPAWLGQAGLVRIPVAQVFRAKNLKAEV